MRFFVAIVAQRVSMTACRYVHQASMKKQHVPSTHIWSMLVGSMAYPGLHKTSVKTQGGLYARTVLKSAQYLTISAATV